MGYYINVLRKYAVFDGRASRKEYWLFQLWNILIAAGLAILWMVWDVYVSPAPWFIGVLLLYGLAIFIPNLAVLIRRLHDTGREGTWFLISFVPLVGPLVLFIFTLLDSQPGENRFGPSPTGMSAAANNPVTPSDHPTA